MKKIFSWFLFVLCLFNFKANGLYSWTQKAYFPGVCWFQSLGLGIGNKGYVAMGTCVISTSSEFWQYNPATNSWTQKASLPVQLEETAGFVIGGKGYIGTGDTSYWETNTNNFFEYDTLTNAWTAKANFGGTPRDHAFGFSVNGKGYIGGGHDSATRNDLWEYAPATDTWTEKASMPISGLSGALAFTLDNKAYVGIGLWDGIYSNVFFEYDPANDTWTQKANFPGPGRWEGVAFSTGNRGYIGTGLSPDDLKDFWQYNACNDEWTQMPDVPGLPRYDAIAFATDSNGYIGLGSQENDFWKFSGPPISAFSTSDSKVCEKMCVDFSDECLNNATAWHWIFAGGVPSSSTDQHPTNICYNIPGIYDVTLITTNANGNDTLTLSNFITVNPTPPVPAISQVGYTLTSTPANSYQWQFNTVDIPGATNQSYTILHTGYYTVIVGDSNSCKNSFTTYVLISSVNDVMSDANISISPNPSNGNFTIEFTGLTAGSGLTDNVSIEVLNTVGQIIFSSTEFLPISTSSSKKEIDLSSVAAGVYIVEVKTKDVSLRKKIVID